jgi:phosphatidylserine decarboxylase
MAKPLPLPVWDRQGGKLVSEWMDDHTPTYESEPQRSITQWIKSQPLFDWLYAANENTHRSAREIEPFVHKYHIDMSEFEPVEYRSFAEFFDRRFRPGVRRFPSSPSEMGAFAEARYFGWTRLDAEQRFPVKGHSLRGHSSAAPSSWCVSPRSITTTCTFPIMAGLWIIIGSGIASGP